MTTPSKSPRTDDTVRTRYKTSRTLEVELGEAVAGNANLIADIMSLQNDLKLANAQIVVKDKFLLQLPHSNYCEASHYQNKFRCNCGRDAALTNSPAAAKELLEQNERMKVAIKDVLESSNNINEACVKLSKALPTTQSAKG